MSLHITCTAKCTIQKSALTALCKKILYPKFTFRYNLAFSFTQQNFPLKMSFWNNIWLKLYSKSYFVIFVKVHVIMIAQKPHTGGVGTFIWYQIMLEVRFMLDSCPLLWCWTIMVYTGTLTRQLLLFQFFFYLDFVLTSFKIYENNYYLKIRHQWDSNHRPMDHEASHLITRPVRVFGRNSTFNP